MRPKTTHRKLLKSSVIIGASSVLGVLFGFVRNKVAAEVVGPIGLGLIGIYRSLITTASAIAAIGFATSGVRSLANAAASHDRVALRTSWLALWIGTTALALIGGGIFWIESGTISQQLLGSVKYTQDVRWLSIGVVFTVIAGSQTAKLNGFRRIGDISRVNVVSALCATILAICALLVMGRHGVDAFVIAAPVCSCVVAYIYARRIRVGDASDVSLEFTSVVSHWGALAKAGIGIMVAGVAAAGGGLVVRAVVERTLGGVALGQFQAAWTISMTYVGYVVIAMATEYFPRLSTVIADKPAANNLVNEQLEVALLTGGPVILGMLALAPWILTVLYASNFDAAAAVLQWQICGDVFKVASFPLAYVMLAKGASIRYIAAELIFIVVLMGITWFGVPRGGLAIAGSAVLVAYIIYFLSTYYVARKLIAFRFTRESAMALALLAVAAASEVSIADVHAREGVVLQMAIVVAVTIYCVLRIARLAASDDVSANRVIAVIQKFLK